MLRADGQADGVGLDALIQQLLLGQLAVGRGGRVNDQTLDVRNIGQQGENFQIVDELVSFFLSALDVECEDRRTAVFEILCIKCVVGMVGQ